MLTWNPIVSFYVIMEFEKNPLYIYADSNVNIGNEKSFKDENDQISPRTLRIWTDDFQQWIKQVSVQYKVLKMYAGQCQ